MWKQIYVNGSSFSDGYGLNISEYLEVLNRYNGEYPSHKENSKVLNNFKKKNNWPGVLESLINIPVINEASFGGSFERVIRMSFDYIFKQKDPTETLFILEIPNCERYDLWSVAEERYKKVTHIDNDILRNYDATSITQNGEVFNRKEISTIIKFYNNFGNHRLKWFDETKNLIMFCSYLKSKNIDFIIIPTEQPSYCKDYIEPDILDKECRFIEDNLIKFSVPKEYAYANITNIRSSDLGYTNNLLVFYKDYHKKSFELETNGELDDSHPSLEGCKVIAEEIYKNIQNRYL